MLSGIVRSLPWLRQARERGDPAITPRTAASFDQAGFILSAAQLWSRAMAASAPRDSDVLPSHALAWLGWRLGLYGRALLRITDAAPVPFVGSADGQGNWTGHDWRADGVTPPSVTLADQDALVVALPQGAPISGASSTASIVEALESAIATEAAGFVGKVIPIHPDLANAGKAVADSVTASAREALETNGVTVALPGIGGQRGGEIVHLRPEYDRGALELRAQLRTEVEAAFGIVGLLSPVDSEAVAVAWRIAAMATFEPLAKLIEAEAADKLDEEITLDRSAWVPASHIELARAALMRGQGASRLIAAGVERAEAYRLMGMDGGRDGS